MKKIADIFENLAVCEFGYRAVFRGGAVECCNTPPDYLRSIA